MTNWKERNKKTDKASRFLDDALGISSFMKSPRQRTASKPREKKQQKKSSQVIIVIDRKNPNKIKIRGFVAKKKHEKKEAPRRDMTMYGI